MSNPPWLMAQSGTSDILNNAFQHGTHPYMLSNVGRPLNHTSSNATNNKNTCYIENQQSSLLQRASQSQGNTDFPSSRSSNPHPSALSMMHNQQNMMGQQNHHSQHHLNSMMYQDPSSSQSNVSIKGNEDVSNDLHVLERLFASRTTSNTGTNNILNSPSNGLHEQTRNSIYTQKKDNTGLLSNIDNTYSILLYIQQQKSQNNIMYNLNQTDLHKVARRFGNVSSLCIFEKENICAAHIRFTAYNAAREMVTMLNNVNLPNIGILRIISLDGFPTGRDVEEIFSEIVKSTIPSPSFSSLFTSNSVLNGLGSSTYMASNSDFYAEPGSSTYYNTQVDALLKKIPNIAVFPESTVNEFRKELRRLLEDEYNKNAGKNNNTTINDNIFSYNSHDNNGNKIIDFENTRRNNNRNNNDSSFMASVHNSSLKSNNNSSRAIKWSCRFELIDLFEYEPHFNVGQLLLGEQNCNVNYIMNMVQSKVHISVRGRPSNTVSTCDRLHMRICSSDRLSYKHAVSLAQDLIECVCEAFINYCYAKRRNVPRQLGFQRHDYYDTDDTTNIYVGTQEMPQPWLRKLPQSMLSESTTNVTIQPNLSSTNRLDEQHNPFHPSNGLSGESSRTSSFQPSFNNRDGSNTRLF